MLNRGCGAPPSSGFGHQPYTTADGKERDWLAIGLSPRMAALTLYGLTYYGSNDDLLASEAHPRQGLPVRQAAQ